MGKNNSFVRHRGPHELAREFYETECIHPKCDATPQSRYHFPIPLCSDHFIKVVAASMQVSKAAVGEFNAANSKAKGPVENRTEVRDGQVFVYYIQFGDRVKIGSTSNLKKRLWSLPHDKVLAIEPGGLTVERRRQKQFEACHLNGDWFMATPELLEFTKSLPRVDSLR